jgi:DNA-binding GntR family transcriptional regulator
LVQIRTAIALREVYFHHSQQSNRSDAQHLQLYREIVEQDAELGQRTLRRHLKGADAYFRILFPDGQSATKHAQRNDKAANIVVARVPRGSRVKLPARR